MVRRFVLNACGNNLGGGLSIYQVFKKIPYFKVFSDYRIGKNKINNIIINYGIRVIYEFYCKFKFGKNYNFLYLSGLPPLFKHEGKVFCVFQNANIFFNSANKNFLNWVFSFDCLRFLYFKIFNKNVDVWLVLSSQSKIILVNNGIKEFLIKTLNIYDEYKKLFKKYKLKKKYDFIYPATFIKHKNHLNLIKALIILSKVNIYPRVLFANACNVSNADKLKYKFLIKKFKLKIHIKNYSIKNMSKAYSASKALIFPSINETLGLPLIEATFFNLEIISSDLPYVYAQITPRYTFRPNNPYDIAKVIKKFIFSKKRYNVSLKLNSFDLNNFESLIKLLK
jgi:glycosyltransferase involved in cell wall biosynthesis